jgi:predicted HicB family RNase H-like nuclease
MKTQAKRAPAKGRPPSADYLKIVEWSDEDRCFVGSAPPIIGPCCHGQDEADVYRQLCVIVDDWVAILKESGKPLPKPTAGKTYSGKFILRIDPILHRALNIRALKSGDSLNSHCAKVLRHSAEGN